MRLRLITLFLLLLPWSPLALARPAPYSSGTAAHPTSEQEQRVWSEAEDFDRMLQKSGMIYRDPELTAYVQGVLDKLYPEFRGQVGVTLLKAAELNAFALPNGSIYVNIGLLSRFQNEAQLATVLAHEGTHFTHRHGVQGQENRKQTAAIAAIIGIFGIYGMVPTLIAASAMFGYSREMESEADDVGYRRLLEAGYDVRESPAVFKHLMDDVKAEDIKEPYFFSTHPKLQDRYDNMTRLSANAVGGGTGTSREDYSRVVEKARIATLELLISMGKAKAALITLENPQRMAELPPYAPYYRGEAYRLRNEPGDIDRAMTAYREAIAAAPDFAPSYRALGILQLKAGKHAEAEPNFVRYLELAPTAVDRRYVERYIKMIESKENQQP